MSDPFCDYLSATCSEDDWYELRRDVSAELDAIGMSVDYDRDEKTLWRSPDADGTVKAYKVSGVRAISASGAVIAGLRAAGRFGAFLAAIGSRPHRVTRLDASMDTKEDAPPVIERAAQKGRAGDVSLTRKSVRPKDVTTFYGVRADGRISGTVYLGTPNADVRLCMYDKQHERMSKGLPDIGSCTRYELRLRADVGMTLRDAYDPKELFWHFMPEAILPVPRGVGEWVANGTGFNFERPEQLPAVQRLTRRVVDSPDVMALARLAIEVGPNGLDVLLDGIRKVHVRMSEMGARA